MSTASTVPNLIAGGNISPYRGVYLSTSADHTGLQVASATTAVVGISGGNTIYGSAYHATAGTPIALQEGAVVQCEAGAAITVGSALQFNSDGRVITAVEGSAGSGYYALESATLVGSEYPQISILRVANPVASVGFPSGSEGSVTQATSITTGVTLNTLCGTITTVSSTLAAGVDASFTLTNSQIDAGDLVVVHTKSYGGTADGIPICSIQSVAAGSCVIGIRNQGAVTLDAVIVISFGVIKKP